MTVRLGKPPRGSLLAVPVGQEYRTWQAGPLIDAHEWKDYASSNWSIGITN